MFKPNVPYRTRSGLRTARLLGEIHSPTGPRLIFALQISGTDKEMVVSRHTNGSYNDLLGPNPEDIMDEEVDLNFIKGLWAVVGLREDPQTELDELDRKILNYIRDNFK